MTACVFSITFAFFALWKCCAINVSDCIHVLSYMQKQLQDNVPRDALWDCSKYVVEEVFEVLRQMFSNAKVIQVSVIHITKNV